MKAVVVLLLTLAVAYGRPQKRFFIKDIQNIFNAAKQHFTHVFNTAKDQFDQLTSGSGINFDNVVTTLIPLIDSGTTEAGCTTACTTAATTVLGPAAPLAGLVCGPVCKAALAKLEEAASLG